MMMAMDYVNPRWRLLVVTLTMYLSRPFATVSASSYRLDPNGQHVCSTTRSMQQFQFIPEMVRNRPDDSEDDDERGYGYGRPSSRRNSPLVSGRQSVRVVNQTIYHCCPGWRASGRECPIAVCMKPCRHGNCSAPDVCSCFPGFMGLACNMACPLDRYGPNCEMQCNCGMRECNSVTGGCTPACPAGSMGPNCVMPCPPGRFGPDCVEFCRCPFMLGGEVMCDAVTGNCSVPTSATTRPFYDSTLLESADYFGDSFQNDTEGPSIVDSDKNHPLKLKAMRLGISGAAGVLLIVLSLILAIYVHRRFKRRPCICVCLQRRKFRTMVNQQRDRRAGTVTPRAHHHDAPRAHFPNPQVPHALPYRLPSLCNYTGLRHTGNRPPSIIFDPQAAALASAPPEEMIPTKSNVPQETIYEVRPSVVAKNRQDQDMSSGYIENNTLSSMSRIVQGCELDRDSVASSVAYNRDVDDDEHDPEEEYDYPYADRAKINMGLDRFQTKRARPGAHEHDNSIYAVVLENEKASVLAQGNVHYVQRNQGRDRDSDILANSGNHGRTHTDPLPLPSHFASPPSDGTYTALIAGPRSPNQLDYPFPERTPGSGSSTAPAPMVLTKTPSVRLPQAARPRVAPLDKPIGRTTPSVRPRGMSDVHHSYSTRVDSDFQSHRAKATVSHVDSNGYTTAIRTFSSMRQPRRPATKRKSRPSFELRQTPTPSIPPRLSESTIPPLSPDPTGDFSMKTGLLKEDSNPRYVNECIIAPKHKQKDRSRSRTPAMMRRAKNMLPMPSMRTDCENDKLYDDILPCRRRDSNT